MTIATRTAPRNARMSRLSAVDDLVAHIGQVQQAAQRSGATMRAGVGHPAMSVASSPDPEPDAPNTPPDTGARLDTQDAQLHDHETRIAALESRMPDPGLADGEGAKPAKASAAARPAATMVDSRAIYGRMSASAAPPSPPMPAAIQTSSGPMLDSGASNARHNAFTAARSR